jgi:hypothetical protein
MKSFELTFREKESEKLLFDVGASIENEREEQRAEYKVGRGISINSRA